MVWPCPTYIYEKNPEENKLKKISIEGPYLQMVKTIYDIPTPNIVLNEENLNPFFLKSRIRGECPLSPLLFNLVPEPSGKKKIEWIYI